MTHIITKNGSDIPVLSVGVMNRTMNINLMDRTFVELATIFSDEEDLEMLSYYDGDEFMKTFSGYIKLSGIFDLGEGEKVVNLVKPEPEE